MAKQLKNSNRQEKDFFYINDYGYYTIRIDATRDKTIEMIDYAVAHSQGCVYKQDTKIEYDEWMVIREFWIKKISPTSSFGVRLGFSNMADVLTFTLRFKGFSYE